VVTHILPEASPLSSTVHNVPGKYI